MRSNVMIIKADKAVKIISEKPRGGKGIIFNNRYLDSHELDNNLQGFYVNELEPGGEIGYHMHEGDEEIYYILEGSGIILDNGKESSIEKGDLIYTKSGESHGMINNGNDVLKFIGFIIKK
jgi:mannose-6-phosphate isomerase-like protein (cupin superfamily)